MEKLVKLWDWSKFLQDLEKPEHTILGLMSGTSADGLDIANVTFKYEDNNLTFQIKKAVTVSYEKEFQKRILESYDKRLADVEYVTRINFELARLHARMVKDLNLNFDFIAYHGQTVYHLPSEGATLQLGEADVLAVELGKPVVFDFRKKDMALGGQGAPISAYFDSLFLIRDEQTAVLNVGGISNITTLNSDGNLIAFDTGPGNCLVDLVCQKYFNVKYDVNGEISGQGNLDENLLKIFMEQDRVYAEKKPPKTTGREVYNDEFLNNALAKAGKIDYLDLLRTLVRFTAQSIEKNIRLHALQVKRLVVVGGGAYNRTLTNDLRDLGFEIIVPDETLINFREAIAIALLGELFLRGLAHYSTVTGAIKPSVLGKLALPV
ncbi:anhydro-N-acetylmuramic acid kinase [Fervidobacterium islandicum]|uniref:anhydro-N-acetylmuramic acid kinase n=1 Tax=Fervidobacterium islandicum TaxID=2423 RepID=UPI003A6E107D